VQAGGWDWQDRTGRPPGIRDKGEGMNFDEVVLELDPQEAWLVRAILLKRVDEMEDDPRFQEGSARGDVTAARRIATTLEANVRRFERLNAILAQQEG
jgi:hypothetical protein